MVIFALSYTDTDHTNMKLLDIIESWPQPDELEDMPKSNLCSSCYTKKLQVMQQNRFGVYSQGGWKETYDYVVKSM